MEKLVLALVLWTAIIGGGGAAVPAPEATLITPVPELRLAGGAFTLRLNTGWLAAAQDASDDTSSVGLFDVQGGLDIEQRRGHLRLGGGDERRLRLAVQWDVNLDRDMARVHSQVDLGFFGHTLTLTPPDVRVRPRFDGGQPGVDVSVPILEGHF
jgi:hypothetical protein